MLRRCKIRGIIASDYRFDFRLCGPNRGRSVSDVETGNLSWQRGGVDYWVALEVLRTVRDFAAEVLLVIALKFIFIFGVLYLSHKIFMRKIIGNERVHAS